MTERSNDSTNMPHHPRTSRRKQHLGETLLRRTVAIPPLCCRPLLARFG